MNRFRSKHKLYNNNDNNNKNEKPLSSSSNDYESTIKLINNCTYITISNDHNMIIIHENENKGFCFYKFMDNDHYKLSMYISSVTIRANSFYTNTDNNDKFLFQIITTGEHPNYLINKKRIKKIEYKHSLKPPYFTIKIIFNNGHELIIENIKEVIDNNILK